MSFIDHGATPPSTLAARNTATTGAPLRACVAAGVLGFGRYHGGDIESCMQFLDAGLALVREGASVRDAATQIVEKSLDAARDTARVRSPLPHPRPARRPAVPDGAGARSRVGSRPHDSRRGTGAARLSRRRGPDAAGQHRRRHRRRLRRPRHPARPSPTRCSSSRACPASPRTPTKSGSVSSRCGRSTPRITATTARPNAGCPSAGSSKHSSRAGRRGQSLGTVTGASPRAGVSYSAGGGVARTIV